MGGIVEYKYVLLASNGAQPLSWQRGNNSVLALAHEEQVVEVYDNWEGQPGASVVSGGNKATREGQLLSWATEIEALVSTQVLLHLGSSKLPSYSFLLRSNGLDASV